MGTRLSKQKRILTEALIPHINDLRKEAKMKYRKVLLLGLDSAGKTCLLYKLKQNLLVNTIPTIGYNHEDVKISKNTTFSFWDLGGQDRLRDLWEPYFYQLHGIMFLVDSNDRDRLPEAKELLAQIVKLIRKSGSDDAVVVILNDKQDLNGALTCDELYASLELNKLFGIRFNVMPCSVEDSSTYGAVLDWLKREIKNRFG